jgi:hypothetical protein
VLAALIILLPSTAAAQAVVDARTVEFNPSPDHDATSDGVPVVTSYQLQIFQAGGSLVQSADLGKPAPESDGLIRMDFVSRLSTPLAGGQLYEARVAAVGPGGVGASTVSNQFSFTPTCAPSLASTSASLAATTATGSVTVNAADGCGWTASSPQSWLTITSADGNGTGTVTFRATANTSTSPRSVTLTIATHAFTVTQSGAAPCTYSISPASRTSPAAGESRTVTVTTGSACAWEATSNAAWLTFSNGTNRTGSGSLVVAIAANTARSSRTGTVTIAGRTFTVTQNASPCSYGVNPGTISVPATAVSGSLSVNTSTGCAWSVSGAPAWMTVSGGTRTGSSTLTYAVTENRGPARSATFTVAGTTVAVSQSGGAPGTPGNLRIVTAAGDSSNP